MPTDAGHVTGDLSSHRATAQLPMTQIVPAICWGLALFAFARLVLAPLGDYFTRRHAAADPWNPT